MRQSNKCGSVRNDEIINLTWDLVHVCLTVATLNCQEFSAYFILLQMISSSGLGYNDQFNKRTVF